MEALSRLRSSVSSGSAQALLHEGHLREIEYLLGLPELMSMQEVEDRMDAQARIAQA